MNGKRFYRRRPATAKRAPVRKRAKNTKPTTKMVKTIVKKALDRRIENKEVVQSAAYMGIYQAGGSTIYSSIVKSLSPTINQAVGENGRIGNTVKLKNAFLRGVLMLGQGATTTVPNANSQYMIRLFIGRLKNTIDTPTTAQLDTLLRAGATTYKFDSGDPLSVCRTVNSELFTVYYDKIHKIGTAHNGGNVLNGLSNNDFKLMKVMKINLTKYYKKNLIFQDTSINQPTNTSLYMWAGAIDALASGTTYGLPVVSFAYDLEFSYEDA